MKPQVILFGVFDMQVCVPNEWTDEQILAFAEANNPANTEAGWSIRRQGSQLLGGNDERVKCKEREGFVHVMLKCNRR